MKKQLQDNFLQSILELCEFTSWYEEVNGHTLHNQMFIKTPVDDLNTFYKMFLLHIYNIFYSGSLNSSK